MSYGNLKEMEDFNRRMDEAGASNAEFIPYWTMQKITLDTPDDVIISAYKKGVKCLLGIANTGKDEYSGALKINLDALGLHVPLTAYDLVTGVSMPFKDGRIENVTVRGRDYGMVLLAP